jgi:RNA polymerase primary sigma factor
MSKFESTEGLPKYFKTIKGLSPLSKEEEHALAARIQTGDRRAVDELVRHNLKLVVKIANRFIGQGVPIDDLIQEGNLGLIAAAERFTADRDTRFSTYASLWIRKHCNEAVATVGKIVRIPMNQEYDVYKKKKAGLETPNFRPVQLDAPISEDSETTVGERYANCQPDIYHVINDEFVDHELKRRLARLKDRDHAIMKMLYGIGYEEPRSSAEVAEEFGLTQIRVCQIAKSALEVMSK